MLLHANSIHCIRSFLYLNFRFSQTRRIEQTSRRVSTGASNLDLSTSAIRHSALFLLVLLYFSHIHALVCPTKQYRLVVLLLLSRLLMSAQGFVPGLVAALRKSTPEITAAPKRSSVAIIIRISGFSDSHYAHDSLEPESFLLSRAAQESTVFNTELLYIKRATNATDPWSGNVAFPGGKHDVGDADDQATAVREALEEVGLDLSVAGRLAFCVGRLSDRSVTARGATRQGFVLCPFVFVLVSPRTPPLALQVGPFRVS